MYFLAKPMESSTYLDNNILFSDHLKTRKYAITISLLKLKCIFLAEPMESRTYLDDHILLY